MKEPLYLFLLALNNSGSTAFIKFLNTSPNTSLLERNGEGQWLRSVRKIMQERQLDLTQEMPWEFIKDQYLQKWNYRSKIILEKSNPNLLRAKSIQKVFPGVKFIVMNRNPYAQCSSCLSRYYLSQVKSIRTAWGAFWRKSGNRKKMGLT